MRQPFAIAQLHFVSCAPACFPVRGRICLLPPAGLLVLSVPQGARRFLQPPHALVLSFPRDWPARSLRARSRGLQPVPHTQRAARLGPQGGMQNRSLLLVPLVIYPGFNTFFFLKWETELMGHFKRSHVLNSVYADKHFENCFTALGSLSFSADPP